METGARMGRRRGVPRCRAACRRLITILMPLPAGERGNSTIENIAGLTALFGVLMIAIQVGMWSHGNTVASAAAQQGVRTAAGQHATITAGFNEARSFAAAASGLSAVAVSGSRSATTATVTVTGVVPQLIPFWNVTIRQTATRQVERVTG